MHSLPHRRRWAQHSWRQSPWDFLPMPHHDHQECKTQPLCRIRILLAPKRTPVEGWFHSCTEDSRGKNGGSYHGHHTRRLPAAPCEIELQARQQAMPTSRTGHWCGGVPEPLKTPEEDRNDQQMSSARMPLHVWTPVRPLSPHTCGKQESPASRHQGTPLGVKMAGKRATGKE